MAAKEIHRLVIFQSNGVMKVEPFEGKNISSARILVTVRMAGEQYGVDAIMHIARDNIVGPIPTPDQMKELWEAAADEIKEAAGATPKNRKN